jgi:hypothetical protein
VEITEVQALRVQLLVRLTLPRVLILLDTLMIEELLKGEVVLFIEKKDGTIVIAGSQLGALAITADGDTGGTIGDLNGFTVTFQTIAGFGITYRGLTATLRL